MRFISSASCGSGSWPTTRRRSQSSRWSVRRCESPSLRVVCGRSARSHNQERVSTRGIGCGRCAVGFTGPLRVERAEAPSGGVSTRGIGCGRCAVGFTGPLRVERAEAPSGGLAHVKLAHGDPRSLAWPLMWRCALTLRSRRRSLMKVRGFGNVGGRMDG